MKNIYVTDCTQTDLDSGAKLLHPFGPSIYQNVISDELVDKLRKAGDKLNIEEDDYRAKLAGNMKKGCSYNYKKSDKEYFAKELSWYVADYMNAIDKSKRNAFMQKAMKLPIVESQKTKCKLSLDTLWINYQKKDDYNPVHTHSGALSFVIFLDVPEGIFDESHVISNAHIPGRIVFRYGEDDKFFNITGSEYTVKPFPGLIFIFPANLSHFVPPFMTDHTRISVSGNYAFQIVE